MSHTHSLHQARSSSLKGTMAAMLRAAQRARQIAAQTHTALVVQRNGVLEFLHQSQATTSVISAEQAAAAQKDH